MGVEESYPGLWGQAIDFQDFDDAEEALSFCDLPIHGGAAADWDDSSSKQEDQSSQSSSSDLDFFEFSSQEPSNFGSTPQAETIVFCGKLIARREAIPEAISTAESHGEEQIFKKKKAFYWKSRSPSLRKSSKESWNLLQRETYAKSKQSKPISPISRSKSSPASKDFRCQSLKCTAGSDWPAKRAPLLKSPTRSRRHSPLLGLARVPPEMEMSEIRNRQRRMQRNPVTLLRSLGGGGEEVSGGRRGGGKGFWGLIRALGCWGFDPNAAVKATFGYVARV